MNSSSCLMFNKYSECKCGFSWLEINIQCFHMYKPQISQTPPETKRKLYWIVSWSQYTELKNIKIYAKIKELCIFWIYSAQIIQRCDISQRMVIRTVKITSVTSICIPTGISPASCYSLNGKEVPHCSKYLNQHAS